MISPPRLPQDELELLIEEARERQRRRQLTAAAVVALAAAVCMSVWAAIPGSGGGRATPSGAPRAGAARGDAAGHHVQVLREGSSGGVTWVINSSGMWLTTNAGRTWRASAPARLAHLGLVDQRIAQVTFLDRRHGWLYSGDVNPISAPLARGAFFRTNDGGRTWQRATPVGCCGNFSFVNSRLGFFFGGKGLYETRNGGATWTLAAGPNYGGSPTFVDASHGATLLDGGLLWTDDGGLHWTNSRLSGKLPAAGNGLMAVGPIAAFGRELVLTAEARRVIPYVSSDAGAHWAPRPFPSWWIPYVGSNDGNRFSAATPTDWFAAARNELAVSTDAGRTWKLVRVADVPRRWIIGSIDFASATVGWAIFDGPKQSVLMRTTDGGVDWRPAGPRTSRPTKR
jgi:photosystem II stability/assembly factor-like uncharacterized protein